MGTAAPAAHWRRSLRPSSSRPWARGAGWAGAGQPRDSTPPSVGAARRGRSLRRAAVPLRRRDGRRFTPSGQRGAAARTRRGLLSASPCCPAQRTGQEPGCAARREHGPCPKGEGRGRRGPRRGRRGVASTVVSLLWRSAAAGLGSRRGLGHLLGRGVAGTRRAALRKGRCALSASRSCRGAGQRR